MLRFSMAMCWPTSVFLFARRRRWATLLSPIRPGCFGHAILCHQRPLPWWLLGPVEWRNIFDSCDAVLHLVLLDAGAISAAIWCRRTRAEHSLQARWPNHWVSSAFASVVAAWARGVAQYILVLRRGFVLFGAGVFLWPFVAPGREQQIYKFLVINQAVVSI